MEIIKGINNLPDQLRGCVLTIGNFDGVHLGHQALLQSVKAKAQQLKLPAAVLTFSPHPVQVLRPELKIKAIFSREDLIAQCEKLGMDVLIIEEFTKELAVIPPQDFLNSVLFAKIKPQAIFVGYDFSFGKNRSGNFQLLRDFFVNENVYCEQIQPVTLNGDIVSSTLIRKTLQDGDVRKAMEMLGRPYEVTGFVSHGDGRGAQIGFPTINIGGFEESLPLKNGVYVTKVICGSMSMQGISNLGTRPTFSSQKESVLETHILNSAENLYHQKVRIEFLERVRDELKFASAHELIKQIHNDVAAAQAYFSQLKESTRV